MILSSSALLRALVAALLVLPLLTSPAHADAVVSRAAGEDRIQTAIQASEDFRSNASDALLATAFSFPDALAASALAHNLDAPMLLTHSDRLPQRVVDELRRLNTNRVWILGGPSAVSTGVEDALDALGFATRRLSGDDRYATASAIATQAGPSATGEVVLALGEHADADRAWPDAVASGALAASPDRVPTVLTRPTALPASTEAALAELRAREVIILGDTDTIATGVESRLKDLGYDTRRVVGADRYAVSVELASEALDRFDDKQRPAVFASGRAFPDALAAGSLAASLGAPLLLVPPTDELPEASESFLRGNADRLSSGVMVGGPAAADDYVVAQLDAALKGEAPPARSGAPAPQPQPQTEAAPEQDEDVFTGIASWYGPGLEGNQTANGETFDPSQLTAAHRTLPFDTIVRVTNLDNGKVVDVRINDRGPFHEDRVLDVSSGAADVLGMKGDGVANIRGEILSYGS